MKPIKLKTIVAYQMNSGRVPFDLWLKKLDKTTATKILGRVRNMSSGTLGDVKTVGGGVLEARVHCGPGYRVYFALMKDDTILVSLVGGDKSSQKSDIERAKQYLLDYKERT